MTLRIAKTFDQADLELLSLASEKRKFGLGLNLVLETDLQLAFERGIDREWFTFVDISFVAEMPGAGLIRVFRLTDAGLARREALSILSGSAGLSESDDGWCPTPPGFSTSQEP